MGKLFDYFYFRFAQKNFKRDGASANTALLNITIVQVLVITNIYLFFSFLFERENRNFSLFHKILFFLLFILIYYLNHKKYKGKYLEFRERWKDETKDQRQMRWVVIIFVVIMSWGLFFINGFIFDKFIKK
jgi:Ca2+/H+ antiporter